MFFSRNRRKSEKRSGKKEKGSDADLSIKVCKHNTITKSRTTAGSSSQATTILISEQKIGENQNKTKSLNTVEHCVNIRTISSHVANSSDSITSHATSGSSSDGVGDEEKPNRRTYSLEQVSKSLDQVMASGKAILDALASVNSKECGKNSDGNGIFDASGTKNERDFTKRGTYDLGDVSELLDASVDSDSSLVVSSNHVSQELPNKGTSTSNIKRKTYELEAVSTRLDQSYEQNTSVEDMLYDLSQDASHNSQNDSLSNSNLKRDTYDLEKIETALDESLNGDVEQTEESETGTKPTFNMNRRGTYDLTDVSSQLDHASDMSALLDNSEKNAANKPSLIMTRRNTYNLNDVSDLLDESGSDKSVQESLDKISSEKLKRKTYDLTDIDLGLIEQSIDGHMLENNNTVTAEKQLYASVIEKSECGPSDLDDSLTEVGSESKKRNTYVLEDSNLPEDNSDSSKLADVLSGFSLDNKDNVERHNVGLTPCQWIEQMGELKPPPTLTKPPTLSPLKLKLKPKKVGASKVSKHISDDTAQLKLRSQSISGVLDLKSSAEIQPRSVNDSKTVSQLKSNSEPNLVTSTPKASNVSKSESIEMDISPGIRNYLANKLGLSEEQCLAVHRRLSGSGVETLPDATKFANRKTYSLDDVAQSLDIATSQGLPMTKVLDNLDTENTEDDTNVAHENITKQRTDSDSNNLEVGNTTAQVENSLLSPPKPQTLDLESATQKSSSDKKTRIPASGSGFVYGSPTAKVSPLEEQFKLVRKKAVYKPSAKLQSFSHLLGGKGSLVPLRRTRGKNDPLKRNTYTLESVAESLEKAQDAGVPMLDALKRLSGSCQSAPSELPAEKRRTYNLEDLSNTLETAVTEGVTIVDTLRTIADPLHKDDSGKDVVASDETLRRQDEIFESSKTPDSVPQTAKSSPKKKAPPKPKRTFSNSCKPEIKFVSDSFVIEYYTSPPAKRSQSDSSVQNLKSGNLENDCVENKEKYHAYINHNILAETIAAGGETPELSAASQSGKDKTTFSIRKDEKPTARVVNDLDSLIMRLAAEVEKPTSVDITKSKSRESIPSSVCIDHDVSSSSKAPESSNEKASPSTKEELPDTESNLSETKPEFPSTKRDFSSTNLSFQNTEPWLPSTKLDDEGYCSLSRKPGTRSISLETSLDDLSKKEKLVTTVEEDAVVLKEKECDVDIICSYADDGNETQEVFMKLTAEEDSETADTGPSNDSSKPDPVSRELNLLRLRLAEKQRDIEAQKQRTKEQLDEERKRFGQNVFWLAVGKGRERKEGNEANSPTKASQHRQDLLVNQNSNVQRSEPTNNNKVATFTKQSSLDGDLPPSMGRLQDRSFDIKANNINSSKSLPEDKASQRFVENRNPSLEHRVTSVEDQNTSEDVVQFRLSRQAPTKTLTDNSDLQNSEKPKTPVLNYKSRMNVPVSIQAKTVSENFADSQNSQDLAVDGLGPDEGECSEVQSQRKCWDTGTANNNEPCIAVSESNALLFGKSSNSNVEAPQSLVMSGSPGVWNSSAQDEQSPEGGSESPHSSPVEDDRETPKKGLALFIGEENAARNNDGLTPEQLRKREKFLRNRQQKIEEEKIKKEALLEKKKRKDEKMREIQLRREEEEQSRQAKLQEKRHQAEHAKQERERYELRKKENLPRTNIVDGGYARISQGIDRVPGGNAGYNKTTVDILGIEGGKGGYARTVAKTSGENAFEIHAPAQNTTPSAFSGFTGVQSYVKPSGKTNRKLIINAISHVCLPGVVNKDTKDKCLQAMTESSAQHFLILFKDGLKFRALYSLDLESNQVLKVYGIGPRSVTEKMTEQLYKYNSGGKEFSKIPAKGFSLSVDGFTLHKSCWQSNKPPVASKTSSNFKQSSYRPTR